MGNIIGMFNKIFDIEEDLEKERRGYINRINQSIFEQLENGYTKDIFDAIYYWLGDEPEGHYQSFRNLTRDDFTKTNQVLILLYRYFNKDNIYNKEEKIKFLDSFIILALENCNLDIGVKWKDGMFYPSGSKLLDAKLIEDPIGILTTDDKRGISIAFTKGLRELLESKKDKNKLKNAVRDMQLALDETTKVLLNDNNVGFKHLLKDKRWDDIIKNKYYQKIFFQLNEFADKLAKHDAKTILDKDEVEFFVYLTGAFIRLVFISK